MFPNISDSWLIILISCVIGFLIGQWIRARRSKAEKNNDYVNGLKKRILAEQSAKTKKTNRKKQKGK